MAALATVDDLQVRLGRALADDELDRVEALLIDASAAFRREAKQTIDVGETTAHLIPDRGLVWLWESPVIEVVSVVDDDDVPIEHVDRAVNHGYLTVDPCWTSVVVTYTHGFATVPDDVVAAVCQMVGRTLGVTPEATAYTSEQTGPFNRSVGGASAAGAAGMLATERAVAYDYRPARSKAGNVRVGSWL